MKFNSLTYQNLTKPLEYFRLIFLFGFLLASSNLWAQDKPQNDEVERKLQKSNNFVYEGNARIENDDFIAAEMEYRKAISEEETNVAGTYNLGNSYYAKGNYEEALFRHTQAAQTATSKSEKHKAFHNIGNILMQRELCKEAVEAYKNALRNDPSDDETRYNLALAKECAEQQQDEEQQQEQEGENEKEQEDENQEKDDEQNEDDQQNEDQEEKKEGDDQKDDQGNPEDEKDDKEEQGKEKEQQGQPKPQQGQLSPQQIKNLLEAMNNQEQKVQQKINAQKQKGTPVKTEKDW